MTGGASLVRFLVSSGGLLAALLLLAGWILLRPHSRAARVALAAVVLGYALLAFYPLPQSIALRLGRPYHPLTEADLPGGRVAIVLLGSGSYTQRSWAGEPRTTLDPIGVERALEAHRLYRMLDDAWIISSGGLPDPDDPDEPTGITMRATLIDLGVPPDRIVMERQSQTTRDEAIVVKDILASLHADHVILVTSPIHMRRALGVFRVAGIEAVAAISRDSVHSSARLPHLLPTADGLQTSQYVLHELLGLAYYRLRGWYR